MSHHPFHECIQICNRCSEACERCVTGCLGESDIHMMAHCIELDRSCADFCALTAREMARGSEFTAHVCALCAEICDQCGAECDKHGTDHCQECAEACRACAEACREMAHSVSEWRR